MTKTNIIGFLIVFGIITLMNNIQATLLLSAIASILNLAIISIGSYFQGTKLKYSVLIGNIIMASGLSVNHAIVFKDLSLSKFVSFLVFFSIVSHGIRKNNKPKA